VELTNEFSVKVPVDEAWALLIDLERIAPCMPGVQLKEIDGDDHHGVVKVKVGPMTAQYKGVASFQERDAAGHRAVVRAEGRDTRGQGTASAIVTATLVPESDGTRVTIHTDLKITGKVAQFGRGVLADVSTKLLRQFVEALEADVLSGANSAADSESAAATHSAATPEIEAPTPTPAVGAQASAGAEASAASSPSAGPRRVESAEAEPVDLVAAAGASVAKRFGPIVAVALIVIAGVIWLLRS
jgi:carbon monoxide dehydrogenase subunit G